MEDNGCSLLAYAQSAVEVKIGSKAGSVSNDPWGNWRDYGKRRPGHARLLE